MGKALTVPLTGISWLTEPIEVIDTFPEMAPAAAVAVDCTYIIVLFTVPAWGINVRLLPKPLFGDVEISKFAGALTEMFPVRLLPETVICCRFGLADAMPAQAEIVPVAWLDVIDCACALSRKKNKQLPASSKYLFICLGDTAKSVIIRVLLNNLVRPLKPS